MSEVRVKRVKASSVSRGLDHTFLPPDEMSQVEADLVAARADELQETTPVTVDDGEVVTVGMPELLARAEADKDAYDAAMTARRGGAVLATAKVA